MVNQEVNTFLNKEDVPVGADGAVDNVVDSGNYYGSKPIAIVADETCRGQQVPLNEQSHDELHELWTGIIYLPA